MPVIKRAIALFLFLALTACATTPQTNTTSETETPMATVGSEAQEQAEIPETTTKTETPTTTSILANEIVSITGQINTNDTNAPIPHAFVQARNNKGMVITVLSNEEGDYQFTDLPAERYSVSARGFGYARSLTEIVETEPSSPQSIPFKLTPDADITAQVSGAEWLSLLPDGDETRQFILDCQGCHQLGCMPTASPSTPTATPGPMGISRPTPARWYALMPRMGQFRGSIFPITIRRI